MKEPRSSSPRMIKEFIHLYKQNPCLWKTSHIEYKNRHTKNEALLKLVPCVSRGDPEANINTVRQKINNIRTSYKRERKKVERSKMSDSGGSVYVPKLWYYNRLLFLEDMDDVTTESPTDLESHDDTIDIPDDSREEDDEKYIVAVMSESSISEPGNISSTPQNPPLLRKRKNEKSDNIHRNRLTGKKFFRNSPGNRGDDEFDNVGKIVAMKLRKLPDRTKIIAERLIHEILYRAQMGIITINSNVVTPATNEDIGENCEKSLSN